MLSWKLRFSSNILLYFCAPYLLSKIHNQAEMIVIELFTWGWCWFTHWTRNNKVSQNTVYCITIWALNLLFVCFLLFSKEARSCIHPINNIQPFRAYQKISNMHEFNNTLNNDIWVHKRAFSFNVVPLMSRVIAWILLPSFGM